MAETITYHDLSLAGETGLKLYLRKNDGSLLNTGGDAFTDLGSSGVFTATLAESRVGLGTLHARVCDGTETADNSVFEEFLPESETVIGATGGAVLNSAYLFDDGFGRKALKANVTHYQGTLQGNGDLPQKLDSIQSSVNSMQTDVDANTGYLTAIVAKFSGISVLADWLRRAFRKDAGTAGMITAQAEINTGGTAAFAGISHSLEAIGTAAAQGVTLTLGATIPLTVGQVTGLTEDLVVGDSYTSAVGRRIPVTLTDSSGNPVSTSFGSRDLSDLTCIIACMLHPENSRNVDNVTAAAQGTCEFVAAVDPDPASLWLSIPNTETSKLSPGVYRVQFRATWSDGETVTLAWKGSCKFVRRIKAKV